MFKDMSPQFVEGSKAWADSKPRTSNPYSPDKQPVWYGRWDKGWMEYNKLLEDMVRGGYDYSPD